MNARAVATFPLMFLSSVLLANAEALARVGDWLSGGYWGESLNGAKEEQ